MEVEEKVDPKAKSQLSEKISINGLSVVRGNELAKLRVDCPHRVLPAILFSFALLCQSVEHTLL